MNPLLREGQRTPAHLLIGAEVPADGAQAARGGLDLRADAVIVGTGPGGAAAARAMAASGVKVILLEEGPATSRFRPNQAATARHHMQEGGSMVARGQAYMPIAAGRGVGGGTLVNSALSFRAPDEVLDGWAELLQDEGFAAFGMGPIYDEISDRIGVRIADEDAAGRNNQLIVQGARALGLPASLAPRSTPGCKGCGMCNFGCPVRGKASTNLTLLPDAWTNGARIQAETRVLEVLIEGGRAVGVRGQAIDPDTGEVTGEVRVRADKVVLSAGAVGTPRLLWHQGIARQLGPVGDGMHVHPGNAVLAENDEEVRLWQGATQGAFFTDPQLPGVLPHAFTAPPEATLVALNMVGSQLSAGIDLLPRLSAAVVMVSDKGNGQVRATAGGRAALRYEFLDEDLDRTKAGMVRTAEVLFAAGARRVKGLVHGIGWFSDAAAFAQALRPRPVSDFTLYAAHPMSTCRMGLDPATSVVGTDAQAHGLPGLYILDASIFPTSLGVNPQLTIMTLATLLGRRIAVEG